MEKNVSFFHLIVEYTVILDYECIHLHAAICQTNIFEIESNSVYIKEIS